MNKNSHSSAQQRSTDAASSGDSFDTPPRTSLVVLVHGLAANKLMMAPLARRLAACGWKILNWGYPSLLRPIEDHSRRLWTELEALDRKAEFTRIHLVTHSMGGVITRHALAQTRPEKLGRIVMLGPPNRGSRAATLLARAVGPLCRPLSQLADIPGSFVNELLEPAGLDIGIIAASNDQLVTVDSTRLLNQADHVIVPYGHTTLLFRRDVAQMVDNFLCSGRFAPTEPSLTEQAEQQR